MTTDFLIWIEKEMDTREWNFAELSRRSGISKTHLSKVFSQNRNVGNEFALGIARAFNYPPDFIYRLAGLLPATNEKPNLDEIAHLMTQLPQSKQDEYVRLLRFWVEEEKRKEG